MKVIFINTEVTQMTCPRCGEKIDGYPCSNCGFPTTLRWKTWGDRINSFARLGNI